MEIQEKREKDYRRSIGNEMCAENELISDNNLNSHIFK